MSSNDDNGLMGFLKALAVTAVVIAIFSGLIWAFKHA